ncbi:MAG TPA: hypothetical protein VMW65_04715 [Chloroflexota bacterium]|nr:hypothetical protein [Chloroflexota bacterium]
MAIERNMVDWQPLRPVLEHLQWGDGLTRDEMMNQSPELRTVAMEYLPPNFRFPDAGSVASYFEQMDREGRWELYPTEPPQGYTDRSPTGLTATAHRHPPSVGGGYGSGNTGSSAQTGVGREGTSTHKTWT